MTNISVGVRGRIFLAFAGITALAALGGLAALIALAHVGKEFEHVARVRVPATLAALDLSRQAERVASFAPRLVADETPVDALRTDRIIRGQINRLETLLAKVKQSASDPQLISSIEKSVSEIRRNLSDLQTLREIWSDNGPPANPVDPMLESAPGVIARVTRAELLAQGQKMIQNNIAATGRLADAVDRLVEDEETKITEANADVVSAQRNSTLALFGVLALSLAGAALIVWLYVGRSIVRRLVSLSSSMLAIAGGHLNEPLPEDRGKDEISFMANALRTFRDKAAENERLRRLKSFLAPQVAELIVAAGDEKILESHRRDVAVLFCDLRGFTAFAEASEPEVIMEFLQDYHETLGSLVDKFGGTLERFTGDGLIVLFNDPLPSSEPCLAAARLAVEMRAGFGEIIQRRQNIGDRLGFGVGIAYGYATLGRIGFKGRFDYTAIGSVVNLASRLCERAQSNEILVERNVQAEIEGRIKTESLGEFRPKGFSRPIDLFNILQESGRPC